MTEQQDDFTNRYSIGEDASLNWEEAIQELAEADSQPLTKSSKPSEASYPPTPRPIKPKEAPQKAAPRSADDLIASFEAVMMEVNKGIQQLRRFESAHPYLIAPNIYRGWEEGMKESAVLMSREFQRLREQRDRGELDDLLAPQASE